MKEGVKLSRSRKSIEMQKKHLTEEEKIKKQEEEESIIIGNEQLKKAPSWLIDDIAKKEFKRITKEFEKINVVGNLDLNNIAGYCNSYALYRQATKELENQSLVIRKVSTKGVMLIENPWKKAQIEYASEMRKFAALCGMTIDSRLKAGTIKTTQQQEDISSEFGDI